MKSRIELTDTPMDMMVKMSEGNPGALTAMMQIIEKGDAIDPQSFMGGIGAILSLDTHEIYGSDIYILWNDKCDQDVRKMLMLMRAVQLGYFSESKLRKMAADEMREANLSEEEFDELDKLVTERLPEFAKKAA